MPSSTRWLTITFAARKTKLQMRKALLLAASFALVLSSCDKDDNNNNGGGGSTVPASYDGLYGGDMMFTESGTLSGVIGDTTYTEAVTVRIYKDTDGHYMYDYGMDGEDSVKVYFNNSGKVSITDDVNQLGTVTTRNMQAQINGTNLEIDGSIVIDVPAANVELLRNEFSAILAKQP